MATLDVRGEHENFKGEINLKFWQWTQGESWSLNTRINEPHGMHDVLCASFSPDLTCLATAGADLCIKTWRLRPSKKDDSDGGFHF